MLDNFQFIFKVMFFVLSLMWSGNILLFRSERQIIVNPVLFIIASVLVVLPDENILVFCMKVNDIRDTLYICYYLIVVWGLVITRRKTDLF